MPSETMLLLAGAIGGAISPFAIQLIKGQFGVKGKPALFLAFVVALAVGVSVAVAMGVSIPQPGSDPVAFFVKLGELTGIAFSLATLIYQGWLAGIKPEDRLGLFANK